MCLMGPHGVEVNRLVEGIAVHGLDQGAAHTQVVQGRQTGRPHPTVPTYAGKSPDFDVGVFLGLGHLFRLQPGDLHLPGLQGCETRAIFRDDLHQHLIGHRLPAPVLGMFYPLLVDSHLPVHQLIGASSQRANLMLDGAADGFPVLARVHNRATIEHADDQVGVRGVKEDVHRVAVHLDRTVESPEDARLARSSVRLMDAVEAPGHVSCAHLSQPALKFYAFTKMKAIALAFVEHVIGVGQGFGWIVEPVFANGHQHFITGEEVHAIKAPDSLKPIRATGFAHVPDGERAAGGGVREGAGWHWVSRQGERRQPSPYHYGYKATEEPVAVGGPDCALHTILLTRRYERAWHPGAPSRYAPGW